MQLEIGLLEALQRAGKRVVIKDRSACPTMAPAERSPRTKASLLAQLDGERAGFINKDFDLMCLDALVNDPQALNSLFKPADRRAGRLTGRRAPQLDCDAGSADRARLPNPQQLSHPHFEHGFGIAGHGKSRGSESAVAQGELKDQERPMTARRGYMPPVTEEGALGVHSLDCTSGPRTQRRQDQRPG
jgi:hypothetical protein